MDCVCRRKVRRQKPVVEITGSVDDEDMEFPVRITVWAADPVDRRQSFSGSGMPFASPEMAFVNNSVVLDNYHDSDFKVTLLEPNAFYDQGGSVYVPPTVFVRVESLKEKSKTKVLSKYYRLAQVGAPYRALSYVMPQGVRPRTSVEFYGGRRQLPYRTQYEILQDSAYPCEDKMEGNFWGLKPPQ